MSESTPSSTSKRFCDVFQMTSKQRGKITQTGSERGTFSYRQQHPNHPELVFSYYRKRSDGSYFEVWMLAEEMELRHQQRVARNLARARARGVPPRKPAAPKAERLKKARISQERTRQKKKRKQDNKLTPEENNNRWEVLALTMGVSVDSIRPK